MEHLDSPLIFLSDYENTVILFFEHPGRVHGPSGGEANGAAFVDRCLTPQGEREVSEAFRILGAMIKHMKSFGFPLKDDKISALPRTLRDPPVKADPQIQAKSRLLRGQTDTRAPLRGSPLRANITYS